MYTLYALRSKPLEHVPTPRQLLQQEATTTTYTFQTITFKVPWNDVNREKESTTSLLANFGVPNPGYPKTIFLSIQPPLYENLTGEDAAQVQALLGSQIFNNYSLYSATLYTTPSNLHFFGTSNELFANSTLLMLKGMLVPYLNDPMYSFTSTHGIKGFQELESTTTSLITFFTPSDQGYTLTVSGATSQELDSILQSIVETGTKEYSVLNVSSPSSTHSAVSTTTQLRRLPYTALIDNNPPTTESSLYSTDGKNIYFASSPTGISYTSAFKAISSEYATDGTLVYFQGLPIAGADPSTFYVLAACGTLGLDANHRYVDGKISTTTYGKFYPQDAGMTIAGTEC